MIKQRSIKKTIAMFLVIVCLVTLATTVALAADKSWTYIGYSCGSKDCGLLWLKNQKYNQYFDTNGYLRSESAGFGACC